MSCHASAEMQETSFGETRTTSPYLPCSRETLSTVVPARRWRTYGTRVRAFSLGPGTLAKGWM